MNSPFLTLERQRYWVSRGYVKEKVNEELGVVTFKYAKKVMYDYLWDKFPELKECRGHTYDLDTGKLVLAAPTKTFNYLENDNWSDVSLDTEVHAYVKFNGFMATAAIHNQKIIVGTTGGTTSDYAKLARKHIEEGHIVIPYDWTVLFEIIDDSDPHVVEEERKNQAVILGIRNNTTGEFKPHLRDTFWGTYTLGVILEDAKVFKGEGFMVYTEDGRCCKIKTDYYVGMKKLMRMNAKNVNTMYAQPESVNKKLPELYIKRNVVQNILSEFNQNEWTELNDQRRREYIRQFVD